jgi:transcriptional regulator with GAF, ATPase, and Fis domain
MVEFPSRAALEQVAAAITAVAPATAFGFARKTEPGLVRIVHSYTHGFGEFLVPVAEIPEGLLPGAGERGQIDAAGLAAHRSRAFDGFLLHNDVRRLVSLSTADDDPDVRFWIGLTASDPLSGESSARLQHLAHDAVRLLDRSLTPEESAVRLQRLQRAAGLLPALLHVLDPRQVFDRLSETARLSLPHDLLMLFLFEEGYAQFRVFARSDRGADIDRVLPNPYPPDSIRVWGFSVVDDHQEHPLERESPVTRLGARSSLRFPIRFDDRVIGGIGFSSRQPRFYASDDVPVGRWLADHVATALSHYSLAQQLAEQARRAEELRARTTSLELLDELLAALTDAGELSEFFGRVSTIARKVLPHDGAALMVRLPDGRRARAYAVTGVDVRPPETTDVPPELMANPDWEYDIFDDLRPVRGDNYERLVRAGLLSLLRVPIRLDGRFAGALLFMSKSLAAFKQSDILVARRMADRMAAALAHDRELAAVKRADEATVRASRLEARVMALTEELDARTGFRRVVGQSKAWRQVLTQATQVAAAETTVLLLGESGTGKEVVARFVHRGSSRKGGPFVALNCAALPDQLLEAELFGYERGAYTGAVQSKPGQLEQAAGGTLFLDEVGEMSLSAQAKFLRVLQEREFQRLGGTRVLRTDARIVAATNRDLQKAIANNQFREDLYYRLNVFAIRLPPLRDRRDDVLALSDAFLAEIGRGLGRAPAGISRDARKLLTDYHWPGNARELRNILERAAILCDGGLITAEHLAFNVSQPAAPGTAAQTSPGDGPAVPAGPSPSLPSSAADLQALERGMIADALQNARYNKSRAAKELGLTRHQLYIRMRKYGLA